MGNHLYLVIAQLRMDLWAFLNFHPRDLLLARQQCGSTKAKERPQLMAESDLGSICYWRGFRKIFKRHQFSSQGCSKISPDTNVLPPLLWFYGPIQPIQKVPGLGLCHQPLSESIPKQQLWVCVNWGESAHEPDSYWTLKLHRQPLHPIKGWGPWDASWDPGAASGVKSPHPALARQPKELHKWAGVDNTAHFRYISALDGICNRPPMTFLLYRKRKLAAVLYWGLPVSPWQMWGLNPVLESAAFSTIYYLTHNLHEAQKPDWQIHILQGVCLF